MALLLETVFFMTMSIWTFVHCLLTTTCTEEVFNQDFQKQVLQNFQNIFPMIINLKVYDEKCVLANQYVMVVA